MATCTIGRFSENPDSRGKIEIIIYFFAYQIILISSDLLDTLLPSNTEGKITQ